MKLPVLPACALAAVLALGGACSPVASQDSSDAAQDAGAVVVRQDAGARDAAAPPDAAMGLVDASQTTGPDAAAVDASEPDSALPDAAAGMDASEPDTSAAQDAGPPVDQAVVVSAVLPTSLACGAQFNASVTMQNTGNTVWSRAQDYKLGAVQDMDPLFPVEPRVWLPEGVTVAPGMNHTFTMTLTAPAAPGSYLTDWQMVHEAVAWFGQVQSQGVTVDCAVPVDASTMNKKIIMGYQGWFAAPGDGSPVGGWVHWFNGSGSPTVDLWPDTSELAPEELYPSGYTLPGGQPANLYSAWNPATVDRHFKWMEDNHLDGVLLQRFISEIGDPRFKTLRNRVTANVRQGAEAHGRVFAVEYDISGANAASLVEDIKNDWMELVDSLGVLNSPRYLHHRGLPVVALWGFGFPDRPGTVAQAQELIAWFKTDAPAAYRVTLIGGVTREWRSDPVWAPVVRTFDVINPWLVGAFVDDRGADNYKQTMLADIADAASHGAEFMPVVFPGFSWKNLLNGPLNQIPRRGGRFYWHQMFNVVSAGAPMVFGAMFDEVDEGTAMFKMARNAAELPTEVSFLPLNADGEELNSDFYLRLADQAGRMLRGELAPTNVMPLVAP